MTRKINLLVGGVAILCFVALVFVPWGEEKQEYTITDDLEIPRIEKTVDEVVEPEKINPTISISTNPNSVLKEVNESLLWFSFII